VAVVMGAAVVVGGGGWWCGGSVSRLVGRRLQGGCGVGVMLKSHVGLILLPTMATVRWRRCWCLRPPPTVFGPPPPTPPQGDPYRADHLVEATLEGLLEDAKAPLGAEEKRVRAPRTSGWGMGRWGPWRAGGRGGVGAVGKRFVLVCLHRGLQVWRSVVAGALPRATRAASGQRHIGQRPSRPAWLGGG
jgi:hypothetical protein